MSSTTPLTQPHLRVIAACAKTLSTTQPFDARVAQVFVSMRTVMSFDEVRLSYWTDFPTRQGLVHVVGGGTWGIAWDDEMVQACIATQSPQTRDASADLPARSGSFAARLYTTTCIPIMANNEVYGVFAFRQSVKQLLGREYFLFDEPRLCIAHGCGSDRRYVGLHDLPRHYQQRR